MNNVKIACLVRVGCDLSSQRSLFTSYPSRKCRYSYPAMSALLVSPFNWIIAEGYGDMWRREPVNLNLDFIKQTSSHNFGRFWVSNFFSIGHSAVMTGQVKFVRMSFHQLTFLKRCDQFTSVDQSVIRTFFRSTFSLPFLSWCDPLWCVLIGSDAFRVGGRTFVALPRDSADFRPKRPRHCSQALTKSF